MEYTRRDAWLVSIICIVACALRLAYLADYVSAPFFPVLAFSDSDSYLDWGRAIASGDMLGSRAFMKWPGYAYFLGMFFSLAGPSVLPVLFFQSVLGSIHCGLIYVLARRFFTPAAAFLAGLLCAGFGLFIFYEGLLVYSALSLFLNAVFFLALLSLRPPYTVKTLFGTGVLLGACVLTQASVLAFGLIAPFVVLSGQGHGRRVSQRYLIFLSGFLITMGAVTARNYAVSGDPVILAGNTGFNFYCGNNPDAGGSFFCPLNIGYNQQDMFRDAALHAQAARGRILSTSEVSAYWRGRALDFIRSRPLDFLRLTGRKLLLLLSPSEYVHDAEFQYVSRRIGVFRFVPADLRFLMPLVLWGMVSSWRDRKRVFLLYLFAVTFAASIVFFFVTARYKLALAPVLLMFAGRGIDSILGAFREKRYAAGSAAVCAVAIGLVFTPYYSRMLDSLRDTKVNSPLFDTYLARAGVFASSGDYSRALEEIERARELEPENGRADFRAGLLYYQAGRRLSAERMFRDVLTKNPLSFDAHYNLGYLMNEQGRHAEALPMLERACKLDPADPRSHFQRALSLSALGDRDNARIALLVSKGSLRPWQREEFSAVEEELSLLSREPEGAGTVHD